MYIHCQLVFLVFDGTLKSELFDGVKPLATLKRLAAHAADDGRCLRAGDVAAGFECADTIENIHYHSTHENST